MKEKAYLGDGVYIHAEYGGVMLTTEDGIQRLSGRLEDEAGGVGVA
jgi:hypothetical protein